MTDFSYEDRKKTYRQITYQEDSIAECICFDISYRDDSLQQIDRLKMSFQSNAQEEETEEVIIAYRYDDKNRPTVTESRTTGILVNKQEWEYAPRKTHSTKYQYHSDELFSTMEIDITYADDACSIPLSEETSCLFNWESKPSRTSKITYCYDSQGRLCGTKIYENGEHTVSCSDYQYGDKHLTFTRTEYGNGTPTRISQTEIIYKY